MRKIKDVLRLTHDTHLNTRQVALSLKISRSTVKNYQELADMASHYGVCVIPARPPRPRDQGQGGERRTDRQALDLIRLTPPQVLHHDRMPAIWKDFGGKPFESIRGVVADFKFPEGFNPAD